MCGIICYASNQEKNFNKEKIASYAKNSISQRSGPPKRFIHFKIKIIASA